MTITKTLSGNSVTMFIKGTIDTATSNEFSDELKKLDYEGLDLTLDFSDTDYITSAGLRVILIVRKKLSYESFRIVNANDAIIEIFKMTGFDNAVSISGKTLQMAAGQNFVDLLDARLKEDKDRTAYIFLDRKYSWADVDMGSQIVAADLAAAGVTRGSHVGLCAPNGIQWVFTFFAIQKLGGIAVFVNPGLKPDEIVKIAGVADVTHLCYGCLTDPAAFDQLSSVIVADGSPVRFMYNISYSVDFTARFDEYPAVSGRFKERYPCDDASVMIFTSGSTGLPKAVLVSSYNLQNGISTMAENLRFCSDDVNLAFLPMFHIFGFTVGITLALLTNYTSVIPEDKQPKTMNRLIGKYGCTVFVSVPTMMLLMIQTDDFEPKMLSSLRFTLLGGAAATEDQLRLFCSLLPDNHFGIIYGMSENAAVTMTKYGDSIENIAKTIGVPVSGVEVEIRDSSDHKALPQGESGEIYVRSDSMIICYYKLDISKQPIDEDGWLATGDLGYFDEAGYVHLIGRVKDLIISGGENISPGEVANAVSAFPDVKDVKILAIPDEVMGEAVAAAVIMKEGVPFDEDAMRDFVKKGLAKYKQPKKYFVFDSFPLLGSGKVDAITLKKEIMKRIENGK